MNEQNSEKFGSPLNRQHNEFNREDELDLRELVRIIWDEKWLIIGITAVAAFISVVVALTMTEIYRAEVTLVPAEVEQGATALSSQIGGAAAFLGVNVGSNGGDDVSNALAILKSRQFVNRFINDNKLLIPLFASYWDKVEKKTVFDSSILDPDSGGWRTEIDKPTDQDAYREFRKILSVVGPDRNTGIVTVAIEWKNPIQAADWLNALISELNMNIKEHDVNEAASAIDYLQQQLSSTQLVEMQKVFYQLIESQTRISMLADVRDEYAFRVIDPAVIPDQKISPRRSLILIIGMLAGVFISLLAVYCKRMLKDVAAL